MARQKIFLVCCLCVVFMLSACSKEGKGPKKPAEGTVRGLVKDADRDTPLAEAVVKIGDVEGLTTPEGTYEIKVIYGKYKVEVRKAGYEDYRSPIEIEVPSDGSTTHDVKVRRADEDAPKILSLALRERGVDFAVLSLKTNEPSRVRVEFGETAEYGRVLTSDDFEKVHSLRMESLEPGKKYVYRLTVEDDRGNTTKPQTGRFETPLPKDTKAPSTRLVKTPARRSRERTAGFAWTGTDDRTPSERISFSFYLEGLDRRPSPYVANTTRIYRELKDGKYTFHIKSRDEDGNVEREEKTFTFEVDTTAPLNPSVLPASGEKFLSSRAVELVCSAEGADEVSLWEGTKPAKAVWVPYRPRKQFVLGEGDGEKIIFARFRDKAGNLTETVSCTIVLDTKPPDPPKGVRAEAQSAGEVRISWKPAKDKGSGVASYGVLRDGNEIGKSRSTSYMDRQVRLGRRYSYSVVAIDRVKRPSDPSVEVVVTVKGKAPLQPQAPNPPDESASQPTSLTLTWRGGDPDRGDTVTYDLYFGKNPNPPLRASTLKTPSFNITGLAPSTSYTWRVEARDLQGMVAKGPVWTFKTAERSNSAPQAFLTVSPSEGKARTSFRFDATGSKDTEDPDSALRYQWDWDGDGKADTVWKAERTAEKIFLKIGMRTVYVHVKDSTGAISKASVRVEVKNSPPEIDGQPMPSHGSTSEPLDVRLSWNFKDSDPKDKLTYNVFFGTAEAKLRAVATRITKTVFKPEKPLRPGKVYYWRVEAKDTHGAEAKSPLWSFATAKKAVRMPFTAELNVTPRRGKSTTPFRFDASMSRDPDDSAETLRVRWDWNGDGEPDTAWSVKKQEVKSFTAIGTHDVAVEVQNSQGKRVKATVKITVENTPPTWVGRPMPRNGTSGVELDAELRWRVSDPDPGDKVTFKLLFAPAGATLSPVSTGLTASSFQPKTLSHGQVYNWKVVAEDKHGGKIETPIYTFTVKEKKNTEPKKPAAIDGPDHIFHGDTAKFSTQSKDPDGDKIKLLFDWGDGTQSAWTDVDEKGGIKLGHRFAREGNYGIKARAVDTNYAKSKWSDLHFVIVRPPRKKGEEEEDLWHWHPDTRKIMLNKLFVSAKYWFANIRGSGRWKGYGDPLADLSLSSDLGISQRKGAPWGFFEFGENISIGLEYFFLEYAGGSTFNQEAHFGGHVFPALTEFDSTMKVRYGQIFAGFYPYLGDYIGGGLKLGAGWFWNKTTITSTLPIADREAETVEFPVPVVGLHLYGRITKYFTLVADVSYIKGSLQEFKIDYGRVLDISGELQFTPVPFVGIALGYRYLSSRVHYDEEGTQSRFDLTFDGVTLSLVLRY